MCPKSLIPDKNKSIEKLGPENQGLVWCPMVYGRGNPTGIRLKLIFQPKRFQRRAT